MDTHAGRAGVLVVDDSEDLLDMLRRLIDRQADMRCVCVLESTVGLEDAIAEHSPDVAVVDLVGPGRDAIEGIRSASEKHPSCRIIAFSGHDDQDTIARASDAGAWLLVSKHGDPAHLLEAIRAVMRE